MPRQRISSALDSHGMAAQIGRGDHRLLRGTGRVVLPSHADLITRTQRIMKTRILPICLSLGLLASVSAQEAPAKKTAEEMEKARQQALEEAEKAKQQAVEELEKIRQAAKRTATISNLKIIGAMLIEFDSEYGTYPDAKTAKDVKDATGTKLKLEGGTSNAYFCQLLAGGGGKTEKIFQFGAPAKPADDKFATDEEALAKGECDFAYLPGANSSNEPGRPLVLGPLVPGKLEFDPKPFEGKALILRNDNSVVAQPINEKGEVIINGKSLFDPSQDYWEKKKPEVAWPK